MRSDLSEYLVHFTKGGSDEHAFLNLKNILAEHTIWGTNNKIKDGSNCICFSEAPITILENGLLNSSHYSPYSPFGILTTKQNLFDQGGRPVIYQSEFEFAQLNEENSWRHMRYEHPNIDFTWEREWRLKAEGFEVEPSTSQIIVPNKSWGRRLMLEHHREQELQTLQYSQIMDELLAMQYEEHFPWTIIELANT